MFGLPKSEARLACSDNNFGGRGGSAQLDVHRIAIGRTVTTPRGTVSPPHFRHGFFRCLGGWILACLLVLPACAGTANPAAARVERVAPAGSFSADSLIVRERKIPILVFYSRPGCSWCEMVRSNYLIPLANDPAYAGRVLIREVALGREPDMLLTDFHGRTTTHNAFGKTRGIRLTPTLDFLNGQGMNLSEPIVGMRLPDFYGAQIERAIEEGITKLRGDTN